MATENNIPKDPINVEEGEIDIIELITKLWAKRKFILKVAGIAMVLGVVFALTTPKSYTSTVILAPESSKGGASSSLANAASMLGLGNISLGGGDVDALRVTLYPDIVSSTPFIIDLMDTQVQPLKSEESLELTEYLKTNKKTLMSNIISLPFKALGKIISLFKSDDEQEQEASTEINPFQLTKKQAATVNALRKSVIANVNQKTGVTTINVTMQDPKVAAMIADTVIVKLQQHITKYRTSKAEDDCKYWEELCAQRQKEYYDAQKRYADYSDANRNVVLQSVLNERERLQNEKALALQLYTTVSTQLQMARAKVQEAKPVFAVVEPATIPRNASSTSRSMMVIMYTFIGGVLAAAWVLFGEDLLKKFKS